MTVRLMVGLGNPGEKYAGTRPNIGADIVSAFAENQSVSLKLETKLKSRVAKVPGTDCYLAIPTTYMNDSGLAIQLIKNFYKLQLEEILIIHDELDFPVGQLRLKFGGGHGGHNGLRDATQKLGSEQYHRLRVGIDHPGCSDKVTGHVLSRPSVNERKAYQQAIDESIYALKKLIIENESIESVTQCLHTT